MRESERNPYYRERKRELNHQLYERVQSELAVFHKEMLGKTPEEIYEAAHGFKWAPSASAWQRQLNQQAIAAAGRIDFIRPLSGEHPRDLQPKAKQSPGRDETVR